MMTEIDQQKVPWWKRKSKPLTFQEWLVEGFGFGLIMFVVMTFFIDKKAITFNVIVFNFITWMIAGVFWGSTMYLFFGKRRSSE